MVASQNAHDSINPLARRVADLERQLAEVGRANRYPFSVAPNGNACFVSQPNTGQPVGSNGQLPAITTVGDGGGNIVLQTDTTTGWGLQYPFLNVPLYPLDTGQSKAVPALDANGSITVASVKYYSAWICYFIVTNPRLDLSFALNVTGTASTVGSALWQVTPPVSASTNLTVHTQTGAGWPQFADTFTFAKADYGQFATLKILVAMTGTVASGCYAFATPEYAVGRGLNT